MNKLGIPAKEFKKLSPAQVEFLKEAEKGHFDISVEDGMVFAFREADTGNLFSMEIYTDPASEEGRVMYTPACQYWD